MWVFKREKDERGGKKRKPPVGKIAETKQAAVRNQAVDFSLAAKPLFRPLFATCIKSPLSAGTFIEPTPFYNGEAVTARARALHGIQSHSLNQQGEGNGLFL